MAYEGPRIFLAPIGNEAAQQNFQNTAQDGVATEVVAEHDGEAPEATDPVHIWGTKPANEGSWKKVESGDYLLFYRDGTYTHSARVLNKEVNEPLSREIWPNFEEYPWELIIYIDQPNEINVSSDEVHDLAGDDITYPMGFRSLNDLGVGGIRGRYGSVEAFANGSSPVKDTGESEPSDIDLLYTPTISLDESVLQGLHFPDGRGDEILDQIESAFNSGKHIIFTGPPGTGKTEIARQVSEGLTDSHPEFYTGYQMTTATADWSTFETVGGYMPTENDGDELSFQTGQVLRRFKQNDSQRNELLVIDEINRADIDKAFGQLFTLLSGQPVQLPYRKDGKEIVVKPADTADETVGNHEYIMPDSWRLFATMNTYDKTSLYELSYAFMRRFSFIHVGAPTIPEERDERVALTRTYTDVWGIEAEESTLESVSAVWRRLNGGSHDRKIGPAIVRDMVTGIESVSDREHRDALTAAVANYVLPQLEGSPDRKRIVNSIADVEGIDRRKLGDLSQDILQVEIDG